MLYFILLLSSCRIFITLWFFALTFYLDTWKCWGWRYLAILFTFLFHLAFHETIRFMLCFWCGSELVILNKNLDIFCVFRSNLSFWITEMLQWPFLNEYRLYFAFNWFVTILIRDSREVLVICLHLLPRSLFTEASLADPVLRVTIVDKLVAKPRRLFSDWIIWFLSILFVFTYV